MLLDSTECLDFANKRKPDVHAKAIPFIICLRKNIKYFPWVPQYSIRKEKESTVPDLNRFLAPEFLVLPQ